MGAAEEPLDNAMLHTVVDLVPGALHVEACVLNGYGPIFGPFLAEELAQGLALGGLVRVLARVDRLGELGAQRVAVSDFVELSPAGREATAVTQHPMLAHARSSQSVGECAGKTGASGHRPSSQYPAKTGGNALCQDSS